MLATPAHARPGKKVTTDAFPGITSVDDSERIEPDGSLASPVLGFVNGSGIGCPGSRTSTTDCWRARPGSETLLESPAGVALPQSPVGSVDQGRPGTGLELTLDEPLQYETEQALGGADRVQPRGQRHGRA